MGLEIVGGIDTYLVSIERSICLVLPTTATGQHLTTIAQTGGE